MFAQSQVDEFQHHLWRFVVAGDGGAHERLAQILNQARAKSVQIAVRKGIPRNDAEDVAQRAIVQATTERALRRLWEKHGCNASPNTYLREWLSREIDAYREERKRKPHSVSLEQIREQGGDIATLAPQPRLDSMQRQSLWQAIRGCLQNDLSFQVLYFKVAHELDARQIAELLCITHSNARRRYSNAVNQLRQSEQFRRACEQLGLTGR